MKIQNPPTFAIRLSLEDREALNKMAASVNISTSHLVRILAREGMKNLDKLVKKYPATYTINR